LILVAHAGTSAAGSFVQTVVLTDVATGWTECVPIVVRDGALVIEALGRARELFPFPLRGVDFDNDSAFMNEPVVAWCREQGLLARLYAAGRLHGNLFQPSFKLRHKTRIGARVIKRYHAPEPPVWPARWRTRRSTTRSSTVGGMQLTCDPVLLLAEIRAAQAELGDRVGRRGTKRPSMIDPLRERIHGWLEAEPGFSAQAVLARLTAVAPARFKDTQLRTVQRAVKAWRVQSARAILLTGAGTLAPTPTPRSDDGPQDHQARHHQDEGGRRPPFPAGRERQPERPPRGGAHPRRPPHRRGAGGPGRPCPAAR
jgi:hypothetical protein